MKIGRIVRVLEDKKRRETLDECNENRKLVISFYYPVEEGWTSSDTPRYKNLFAPKEDVFIEKFRSIVKSNNNYEKDYHLKNIKTSFYNDAPISSRLLTYPVIVQSCGLGCPRDYMSYSIEKLVKSGYVVFTVDHPYDSMLTVMPNGRILEPTKKEFSQSDKENLLNIRKNDLLYLLDELPYLNENDSIIKDKLDLNSIILFGHSLGGASCFKAAVEDSRVKSLILLDASFQFMSIDESIYSDSCLNIPILNLRRGGYDYENSMKLFIDFSKNKHTGEDFKTNILTYDKILRDSTENQDSLKSVASNSANFYSLQGTNHLSFSDYPLLANEAPQGDSMSPKSAHNIIRSLVIAFLEENFNEREGLLEKVADSFDDVKSI